MLLSKLKDKTSVVNYNNWLNIGLTNFGWIETNSDKLSKEVLPAS